MDGVEGQCVVGSGDRPVVPCNGVDALGGDEGELVLHRRWKCAWELGAQGHGAAVVDQRWPCHYSRIPTACQDYGCTGDPGAVPHPSHRARVIANAKKGILAVACRYLAHRRPIKADKS